MQNAELRDLTSKSLCVIIYYEPNRIYIRGALS